MRLPNIDRSRALGAYAAVVTVGLAWFAITAATANTARFDTIDVGRINVREPDGTLRMVIANRPRMPGLIIGKAEYPHPNRHEAGMIFYNDEGIENGGLVFDGAMTGGKPTNSGSLTFDRYRQDQTVQLTSIEDGDRRHAGLIVNDRPDRPIDFARIADIRRMSEGPARTAAMTAAGLDNARRAFLGSTDDRMSRLDLSDAGGHARLRLEVAPDGKASIAFLDSAGHVTRTIAAP